MPVLKGSNPQQLGHHDGMAVWLAVHFVRLHHPQQLFRALYRMLVLLPLQCPALFLCRSVSIVRAGMIVLLHLFVDLLAEFVDIAVVVAGVPRLRWVVHIDVLIATPVFLPVLHALCIDVHTIGLCRVAAGTSFCRLERLQRRRRSNGTAKFVGATGGGWPTFC